MDDILHDDILLFILFLCCVHFSSILTKQKTKKSFVITRGQVEVTTERTQECFSSFCVGLEGMFLDHDFLKVICKSAEPHLYVYT